MIFLGDGETRELTFVLSSMFRLRWLIGSSSYSSSSSILENINFVFWFLSIDFYVIVPVFGSYFYCPLKADFILFCWHWNNLGSGIEPATTPSMMFWSSSDESVSKSPIYSFTSFNFFISKFLVTGLIKSCDIYWPFWLFSIGTLNA